MVERLAAPRLAERRNCRNFKPLRRRRLNLSLLVAEAPKAYEYEGIVYVYDSAGGSLRPQIGPSDRPQTP